MSGVTRLITNPLRLTAARRINLGKRAGVASGLLGILCILAELCFLLPDLLVTPDALPMYKANLGLFRGILQAAIVATFALGFYSTLRLRSKLHGLAGIALGSIALLMGGAEAEAIDIGPRGFSAGLDYFVLELLVLGLLFVPMEQFFALRRQRIFRSGWQTDLKHFFVSHAGVQLLSFASMIPAQAAFAWALQLDFQKYVAAQPLAVQFVEILLAVDLMTYWVHRTFHKVPLLWNFHAIHHSSREMDWLAGSRMHLVDVLVTRAAAFIPVFVLGFAPAALYAYLVFVSFHAVFIHANVRWRLPGVRWVIATPEFHHWHHTSDEEGLDRNFAGFLPMWDVLFGTAHQPEYWPKNYGTVKFQPPETWVGQLLYPFRKHGERTPYG
jgi:sterol desaturase/sphingolipid hydroxylase (fatty acid hydroxylase superfamily)